MLPRLPEIQPGADWKRYLNSGFHAMFMVTFAITGDQINSKIELSI